MSSTLCFRLSAPAFLLAVLLAPLPAVAQSVAMSCAQAVSTYERSGRISVTTRGGATLPLYEGVKVSARSSLRCSTVGVTVAASDNRRCVIAYKCAPQGHGGR
ncbi:MAG: hypothetical protein VYD64_07650 [Pseudomonadota bacterium]|nr:hypothetical protein [Pseudomonadota bacterium]